MIDRLLEAFQSRRIPLAQDEFVHPSEFKAVQYGRIPDPSFRGLLDRRTIEANENSSEENEAAQCWQA
jgi:hypothetical protein